MVYDISVIPQSHIISSGNISEFIRVSIIGNLRKIELGSFGSCFILTFHSEVDCQSIVFSLEVTIYSASSGQYYRV